MMERALEHVDGDGRDRAAGHVDGRHRAVRRSAPFGRRPRVEDVRPAAVTTCSGTCECPKITSPQRGKRSSSRSGRRAAGPPMWIMPTRSPSSSTTSCFGISARTSSVQLLPQTACTGWPERAQHRERGQVVDVAGVQDASAAAHRATHSSGSVRVPFGRWVSLITRAARQQRTSLRVVPASVAIRPAVGATALLASSSAVRAEPYSSPWLRTRSPIRRSPISTIPFWPPTRSPPCAPRAPASSPR